MNRDLLSYWKPDTALQMLEMGGTLHHSASSQYRLVEPGDTVWIVSVLEAELVLLGRILVSRVQTYEEAVEDLQDPDLWEAPFHIRAQPETEVELNRISIQSLAGRLRFLSARGKDRLTVIDGHINPQQLQTMRILDSGSAKRLRKALLLEQSVGLPRLIHTLRYPDEQLGVALHLEGGATQVEVNRYERDAKARMACLAYHGTRCQVCGLEMGEIYGPDMEGYIHVHHLQPLSKNGVRHVVDPVRDLRPICPNCHAFIHHVDPPVGISQARKVIESRRRV
jgi:hypothetical protein